MTNDVEKPDEAEDPTAAARAAIFGAFDGSTIAEAEATEDTDESTDDAAA